MNNLDLKISNQQARSKNCEKRLLASPHICFHLSVCTERYGSHWTDFHKISYSKIIRISQETLKLH